LASRACVLAGLLSLALFGCGRIISSKATDQLLAGDAVDRTISQIDFRILTGRKVFLDTQYINKTIPGVGFVTSEYIVSSVRQKMMCDGCLLQEKTDESDFVVEMRIGALGADGHEVIYGMPTNNLGGLATSMSAAPNMLTQAVPAIPELSVGKIDDQMAAAKIGLFAYNRRTREPIWQSGLSEARSTVDDRWYFGAGPFHKGTIHSKKKHAQSDSSSGNPDDEITPDYFVERRFADPTKSLADNPPAAKPAAVAAATPDPAKPGAPAANPPAAATAATPTVASNAPPAAASAAKPATPPAAAAPAKPVTAATPAATTPADPKNPAKTDPAVSAANPTMTSPPASPHS
jgi:hypothetical protein